MNKINFGLLIVTELALVIRLIANQDLFLAMLIVLSQLVIAVVAVNFESKERSQKSDFSKKTIVTAIAVTLATIPLLLFHEPKFEPSTWLEASLLVQGPFSIMLILFGAFSAVVATASSLYLRGKK